MVGAKAIAPQYCGLRICDLSGIAAEGFDERSEMRKFGIAAVGEVLHVIIILSQNPTRFNEHLIESYCSKAGRHSRNL